jgi:hypothetical protein
MGDDLSWDEKLNSIGRMGVECKNRVERLEAMVERLEAMAIGHSEKMEAMLNAIYAKLERLEESTSRALKTAPLQTPQNLQTHVAAAPQSQPPSPRCSDAGPSDGELGTIEEKIRGECWVIRHDGKSQFLCLACQKFIWDVKAHSEDAIHAEKMTWYFTEDACAATATWTRDKLRTEGLDWKTMMSYKDYQARRVTTANSPSAASKMP